MALAGQDAADTIGLEFRTWWSHYSPLEAGQGDLSAPLCIQKMKYNLPEAAGERRLRSHNLSGQITFIDSIRILARKP